MSQNFKAQEHWKIVKTELSDFRIAEKGFSCPEQREKICSLFAKEGKCDLCDGNMYFEPIRVKPKPMLRTQKKSERMGSRFEEENHKNNVELVGGLNCFLTPNSGAGSIYKGDEWIQGFISVMQELKTNVKPKIARGSKTYTCRRAELEKVKREGVDANVEFMYLKFRFNEADSDTYTIISDDVMDSVIAALVEDRKKVQAVDSLKKYYEAKDKYQKSRIVELEARIISLENKIGLLEAEKKLSCEKLKKQEEASYGI